MTKLIIWIAHHPDVKVRFNYDPIFNAVRLRMIKGRYISERLIDKYDLISLNRGCEDNIISLLNHLYDNLTAVEKEVK